MKYGIAMFPTDQTLPPGELARLVEDAGFESVFFPEHSHIPAARRSHFAADGAELPSHYWHTYDLFVALTAAAGATSRLRLGSGLCLLPQRDPIWTAKAVASVDRLSGGRRLFGIGAGWNREEMESHGYDFRTRFSRMGHHVQAMKALWNEDEASYSGREVTFERAWAWPKPIQRPSPPLLIGGAGPKAIDRIVEYGDGWLAEPAVGLESRIDELMARAEGAGREGEVTVTIYGAEVDDLVRWERPGVERCVFWVQPGEPAAVRAAVRGIAQRLEL